jgi:hypothetical protein
VRAIGLIAAGLALLAPASAAAQSGTPHVVASANGATARSSADQGEVVTCNASGCTSAITAPARPPATWDGELPVTGRSVIEVTFGRPVDLIAADVVDRSFQRVSTATVERIDAQHWRVALSAGSLPDEAAIRMLERWTVESERGRSDVTRTDFVGLESPAVLGTVKQPRRGGGAVAPVELRTPGLVDARLGVGKKTLGQKSRSFVARRFNLSVSLSSGARRLLAERRVLKATLTLTVRPPSGDPVVLERRVTLRAKR